MKNKVGFMIVSLILLVPFVSAAFSLGNIDVGNVFSSGKMFAADNWNPRIAVIIGVIAFIVFFVGRARHAGNSQRAQIADTGKGLWAQKGLSLGGKVIDMLRGLSRKRKDMRDIENRLAAAEIQLEKYEVYLT